MRRILMGCFALLAAVLPMGARPATAGEAATVEATVTSKELKPGATVEVAVKLSPGQGVHLYRDKVKVELVAPPAGLSLGKLELPAGKKARDELSGGEVEYYYDPVSFTVPVIIPADFKGDRAAFTLKVGFQGCTETFCLAPAHKELELEAPPAAPASAQPQDRPQPPPEPPQQNPAQPPAQPPAQERTQSQPQSQPQATTAKIAVQTDAGGEGWAQRAVRGGGLLGLVGAFVLGLLVSFTPCVYPMIPVTVALIGGAAAGGAGRGAGGGAPGVPRRKSAVLGYTVVYVMGIALTYSVLGVAAASTGRAFGSWSGNPAVQVGIGLVMAALALSMFGAFDLALPGGLAARLGVGRAGSGASLPVLFLTGAVLGLVASPCVSAPLLFLLAIIGERGNLAAGALSLFAFAWGMSALLILAGLFPGFLARPGEWMNRVKVAFGVIMAAMGLYFVRGLLPAGLFGWAGLSVAAAVGIALLVGARWLAEGSRRRGLVAGLGGIALVGAAYLSFGASIRTGALTGLARAVLPSAVSQGLRAPAGAELAWQAYSSEVLSAARDSGRPVLIDFYTDGCISCLEMEEKVFSDPAVVAAADTFVRLRLNCTDNDHPEVRKAEERFKVQGYPTVVVLDSQGREAARAEGFTASPAFLEKLRAAR